MSSLFRIVGGLLLVSEALAEGKTYSETAGEDVEGLITAAGVSDHSVAMFNEVIHTSEPITEGIHADHSAEFKEHKDTKTRIQTYSVNGEINLKNPVTVKLGTRIAAKIDAGTKFTGTRINDGCKSNPLGVAPDLKYYEYVSLDEVTATFIIGTVGYKPVHTGSWSMNEGVNIQCWHFADTKGKALGSHGWDSVPILDFHDPKIGYAYATNSGPSKTKRFSWSVTETHITDHFIRCGIIDPTDSGCKFDPKTHCASSASVMQHFANVDVPFEIEHIRPEPTAFPTASPTHKDGCLTTLGFPHFDGYKQQDDGHNFCNTCLCARGVRTCTKRKCEMPPSFAKAKVDDGTMTLCDTRCELNNTMTDSNGQTWTSDTKKLHVTHKNLEKNIFENYACYMNQHKNTCQCWCKDRKQKFFSGVEYARTGIHHSAVGACADITFKNLFDPKYGAPHVIVTPSHVARWTFEHDAPRVWVQHSTVQGFRLCSNDQAKFFDWHGKKDHGLTVEYMAYQGNNNKRYATGLHTPWAGAQSGQTAIDQLPVSVNAADHQCQRIKFEVPFDDLPLVLGNLDQNIVGTISVDQSAGEVWLANISREGFDMCMKKGDLVVQNFNWLAMEHKKERQFKDTFRSLNPNIWSAAGRDVAAEEWISYPSLTWREGTRHKHISTRCREIPYNSDGQHPAVFYPIPAAVFVTGHYRSAADDTQPIITFVDEIHSDRFKVCVTKDNLKPGDLKDVAFDWVAFK